ncbi:hypothetical protein FACS18949_11560 [Clostridia bacterium]|nr:hypothetical protein FACS18949_11560 [Clostridia bacterium]
MLFHIDRPYDYAIPDGIALVAGQRVTVPFGRGNKPTEAVILAIAVVPDDKIAGLKSVLSVLDLNPLVDERGLRLALWMSERFFCTVYEALRTMLPDGLWKLKKARKPKLIKPMVSLAEPITLNASQQAAYDGLSAMLAARKTACALLYGVTGSGKTMVYIELIREAIADGGGAIVLVPEIALTPQLITTFAVYFEGKVAVLHSSLGVGERFESWKSIKSGEVKVVVGTRSAVFAPVSDLRLIIIDEEQEHTYKSENSPRYHARDVAKFRCVLESALLVLVSATPSVESAFGAASGAYTRFELPDRANNAALPDVKIADLREDLRGGGDCSIGAVLREEIEHNLERGEQTVLLLNRRGFHRVVTCPECGKARMCPNCSVTLTYHADTGRMLCHYCNFSTPKDSKCPECGSQMRFIGAGTQKVESDLQLLFPGLEVLRMDADTTGRKSSHAQLLTRFEHENIPVLVGTQMIAKGLNLPNVTLAGVINADMSLALDDYRANERTFSLIAQLVGRAGRAEKAGRAVIQSLSPKNPVLLTAAAQDYDRFYETEISMRSERLYPPFGELLMIRCFGSDGETLLRSCNALRGQLDEGAKGLSLRILGPAPASVLRVNNRFRYQITLCGTIDARARRLVAALLRNFPKEKRNKGVTAYADLHPNGF